jgi:hypothetical protein
VSHFAPRARELAARVARKDGKQVVALRCLEQNDEAIVECEVYPVSGLQIEPLRPGPYQFRTRDEAGAFMDEAMQALTYLGCETS